MPFSGPHFSTFKSVLMPKCSIQGAPWRPGGSQMAPQIAEVTPKWRKFLNDGPAFLPTCFQGRFRTVPGHQFGWFWMDFGWILKTVCIICNKICILGGMDFEWILKTWSSAIPPGTNIKQNNQHKTNTSSDYEHVRKVFICIVGP